MFRPEAVVGHNVRMEEKRVILSEVNQPPRSVFNIGQLRHDVVKKEDLNTNFMKSPNNRRITDVARPNRLIQWDENPNVQRYDQRAQITMKIGSPNPLVWKMK